MAASKFHEIKERYLPEIEKAIAINDGTLSAAMTAYHMETGGKRLRALIPLHVYQVLGHDPMKAVPLGAAIEMIHNATLVHDDLQDGDEIRRDRPTVWKKYSEAQAINCGDAMFQYAFRLLAKLNVEPAQLVRLMDRSAHATLNVIEGQAQEFLMKEESYPNTARYLGVIRGKTSGLFALPIVGAMESLGIERAQCEAVEAAAMDLGMLFQIQDDVLDVYGKKGRGDQAATDVAEGKISFFVAHVNEVGTESDKAELTAILRKARAQTTPTDIRRAIEIFEKNDAKGMALNHIRKIQREIKDDARLNKCPEIRQVLIELGELFLEPVNGVL